MHATHEALRRGLCLIVLSAALTATPAGALPAQPAPALVAVELPTGADAAPGPIAVAAPGGELPSQQLPDGATVDALPGFAAVAPSNAPATLLREGLLRGRRIAIYAVAAGGPSPAALASALGPEAHVVTPAELSRLDTTPFVTGAPPPNPGAAGQAWKIIAAEPGLQVVSADALVAAGFPLGSVDPATLQLHYAGREVAIEMALAGGALAELRFFAEPGDRWNATATYWLTVGQGPGLRMDRRGAAPAGAPVGDTAVERGTWRTNSILETRLPGPDGDRFFSADLRTAPLADGGTPASVTATFERRLPQADGEAILTVAGGSVFGGLHALRVTVGGVAREHRWSGAGTWSARLTFPAARAEALVELLPRTLADGVHLDSVAWELPARLDLGGQGAVFTGRVGRLGYRLAGPPASFAVYDVSEPARPARLAFSGEEFEDGGTTARRYLVAGPGTLHRPAVAAHTPVDLSRPLDAEAIYVAPGAFLPALEPLLQYRREQGLRVVAVSTEAIYDAWSFGQVSPEAIRSFLRFAAERWAVAPTTVVLVGDGSSDPRNYLGRGNITRVPPYLAEADPWLGETACDACFARLHGDDPLRDLLPDLTFGRIPAKSADELLAIVGKLLAYERSRSPGLWRATVAFVADNPDLGGNFLRAVERSVALQPAAARIGRVAYDPDAPAGDPWREADPLVALARSMGSFNTGAAVLHYVGHGLQFQWGYTGPPLRPGEPTDRQYLLGLFGVDELQNGARLPIVLSMTCLTGSFQIPAFSGTAIDERLVARPDGGAIAAWSSTGLGVLYGHEALQRGFYRALWGVPGARLGDLTLAGYIELFATEACCQESIGTFVLLGDPLTLPRMDLNVKGVQLPLVRR